MICVVLDYEGESPASVYSLYANNGDWYPYFAKDKKTQTSFKASGSADIGSHEFSFDLNLNKETIHIGNLMVLETFGS